MTTRQTIASPTPAHINRSSPISKKNLSRNRTHFPKNPSHLNLNRLVPPNLLKEHTWLQMRQVRQTVSSVLKRIEPFQFTCHSINMCQGEGFIMVQY